MEKSIVVEREERIATITLNRSQRLNSLTKEMMIDLRTALEELSIDDRVRVICLTGAGRAFCTGQDLSERDPRKQNGGFDLEAIQKEIFHPVILLMQQSIKPIVAMVNGVAAGAGVSLALACDIVVAKDSASFAQSFSSVGLSVDAGGGWYQTKAIGPAKSRAILMLSETISAVDAENMGLIYKSVSVNEFDEYCSELLQKLNAAPSTALKCIKKAVAAAQESPNFHDYLEKEAYLQGEAGKHQDYAEGTLAFLEKRAPQFT